MASKEPPKAPKSTTEGEASTGRTDNRPPKTRPIPVLKPVYSDWALI